jgi:hypothetical protein
MHTSQLYTLWDILSNNVEAFADQIPLGIEVPMIQRDYAQGRESEKPTRIREKFLSDIHAQLLAYQTGEYTTEPLEMDFIYGYLSDGKFVPLDGQQRLTTLYLVHWFVFFNERMLLPYLHIFNKFTYNSRVSSREFFEKLNTETNLQQIYQQVDAAHQVGETSSLAKFIQNQNWFRGYWMNDPTIQSVFRMLTDIEEKFVDISSSTLVDQRPLCFNLLIIPDNGLGDSMYIKMNARGKGLTDFENFKAILEAVFSSTDSQLQKEFSNNIDKHWLDQVWRFGVDMQSTEDRSVASGNYLLQLITAITELVFYREATANQSYQFNDKIIQEVYCNSYNLQFLIASLNQICSRPLDAYTEYFANIYSSDVVDGTIRYTGKSNVVAEVLKNTPLDNTDKLMFFAWLIFIVKSGNQDITQNMKDYLRICRNYINSIVQTNRREYNLTTNIRTENFNGIIETFYNVFDQDDIYQSLANNQSLKKGVQFEVAKAKYYVTNADLKPIIQKLEDHDVFRGQIFNVDLEEYTVGDLQIVVDDFFSLFNTNTDTEIVQLLITLGYAGVSIAWTPIGTIKLWGKGGRWHRVMASPDGEIRPILIKLFALFLERDRTLSMSEFVSAQYQSYLGTVNPNSLNYYWVKYQNKLDFKLYSIKDENQDIPTIELFESSSIIGYHINPFVLILKDLPELEDIIDRPSCYSQHSILSRLQLKNGASLSQENLSWVLHGTMGMVGLEQLILDYNLKGFGDSSFQYTCDDLIVDAIPFVKVCASLQKHALSDEILVV